MKTPAIRFVRLLLCAGVLSSLTACNSSGKQSSEEHRVPVVPPAETERESQGPLMTMRDQVAWAVNDLANRRGVAPQSIAVVNARPVTWRSGAVGCPQPGVSYTQALVPGVSVLLNLDEVLYAYHAKAGGRPFHCPFDRAELPVYGEESDQI